MPLVALLSRLGPLETLIATFAVTVLGVWAAEVYVASSSQGDPQEVIIDEVAGYLIAMVWLPLTPFYFVGTFLVFRFLDILKPPPISLFDLKDKGGVGVMVDDIVAGLLTNLLFQWIFQAGVLKGWM